MTKECGQNCSKGVTISEENKISLKDPKQLENSNNGNKKTVFLGEDSGFSDVEKFWEVLLPSDSTNQTRDTVSIHKDDWFPTTGHALSEGLLNHLRQTRHNNNFWKQTADFILNSKIETNLGAETLQAIFRFLRIGLSLDCLLAIKSEDNQHQARIKTMTTLFSKLCVHVYKSNRKPDVLSSTIAMVLFYIDPLIIHHKKIALIGPTWRSMCELWRCTHDLWPSRSEFGVSRQINAPEDQFLTIFKPLIKQTLEAIHVYFEQGTMVVNAAIESKLSPQNEVQAYKKHLKILSFLVVRFTLILPILETYMLREFRPESMYAIIILLAQWRGALYLNKTENQVVPLKESLESLEVSLSLCLDHDSLLLAYELPVALSSWNYMEDCRRTMNKRAKSTLEREHVALGIIIHFNNKQSEIIERTKNNPVLESILNSVLYSLVPLIHRQIVEPGSTTQADKPEFMIRSFISQIMERIAADDWLEAHFKFSRLLAHSMHPASKHILWSCFVQYMEHRDINDLQGMHLLYTLSLLALNSCFSGNNAETISTRHCCEIGQALKYLFNHMKRVQKEDYIDAMYDCLWYAFETAGSLTSETCSHVNAERALAIAPLLEMIPTPRLLSSNEIAKGVKAFCQFLISSVENKENSILEHPLHLRWSNYYASEVASKPIPIMSSMPLCFAILSAIIQEVGSSLEASTASSFLGMPFQGLVSAVLSITKQMTVEPSLVASLRFLKLAICTKFMDSSHLTGLLELSGVLSSLKNNREMMHSLIVLEFVSILNHVNDLLTLHSHDKELQVS